MPLALPQLTRAELVDLLMQRITSPLNKQNTAERVREVIEALISSCYNKADDAVSGDGSGLPGDILAALVARQGSASADNAYALLSDLIAQPSANVPAFNPAGLNGTTPYPGEFHVTYILDTRTREFVAKATLDPADFGGTIPAPTGEATDSYWTEVNPYGPGYLAVQDASTQLARSLQLDGALVTGRGYRLYDTLPGYTLLVYAASPESFETQGYRVADLDSATVYGTVDVAAGTFVEDTGGAGLTPEQAQQLAALAAPITQHNYDGTLSGETDLIAAAAWNTDDRVIVLNQNIYPLSTLVTFGVGIVRGGGAYIQSTAAVRANGGTFYDLSLAGGELQVAGAVVWEGARFFANTITFTSGSPRLLLRDVEASDVSAVVADGLTGCTIILQNSTQWPDALVLPAGVTLVDERAVSALTEAAADALYLPAPLQGGGSRLATGNLDFQEDSGFVLRNGDPADPAYFVYNSAGIFRVANAVTGVPYFGIQPAGTFLYSGSNSVRLSAGAGGILLVNGAEVAGGAPLSTATPQAPGTATPGTTGEASDAGHVHPLPTGVQLRAQLGVSSLSGANTGDDTAATIKSKLGISILSGVNTGDQDLSGYATTGALSSEATARTNADATLQSGINANTTAIAGKEATGVAATLDTALLALLRDGVDASGDTLQKLYNMVQLRAKQYNVATIAARNALNVTVGTWVNVDDDGDGRWAIYRATTAGTNATYNKVSDPDLLNAAMTAAQIKSAYESNSDTNPFTNALLAKLNAIAAGATVNNTDAYLLARVNHTGTQAIVTVAGLQGALDTLTTSVAANTGQIATNTGAITALKARKLTFSYPAGSSNDTSLVVVQAEVGTYTTERDVNVASRTFYVNGVVTASNASVVDGDTLRCVITPTDATKGAYIELTA